MKITFILQYFYPDVSGLSQIATDLTVQLSLAHGIGCTVLAGSSVRSVEDEKRLPDTIGPVQIQRVRTLNAGKATFLHRLFEHFGYYVGVFVRLLFRPNADVVVCFTTPPLIGLPVALALWFRRTPVVYYVQDLHPELLYDMGYIRKPWLIRRLSIANRLILRKASATIVIGSEMAEKLVRNYRVPRSKLTIVPNWSKDVTFSEPEQGKSLSIMYSGNIGLAHGFDAFRGLISKLSNVDGMSYRFVGAGRQSQTVRDLFQSAGESRVVFEPFVPRSELSASLARADFFVVAQKEETVGDILPSKYYGYLAAGRPILYLGTRKSEIGREILEHDLGFVLETPWDVENAARRIKAAHENRTTHSEWCRRIATYSSTHYGLEQSTDAVARVLMSVAKDCL